MSEDQLENEVRDRLTEWERASKEHDELRSLSKYKQMVDAWGGWVLLQDLLLILKSIAEQSRFTNSRRRVTIR